MELSYQEIDNSQKANYDLVVAQGYKGQWLVTRSDGWNFSLIQKNDDYWSVMDVLKTRKVFGEKSDAETYMKTWEITSRLDDIEASGSIEDCLTAAGTLLAVS